MTKVTYADGTENSGTGIVDLTFGEWVEGTVQNEVTL